MSLEELAKGLCTVKNTIHCYLPLYQTLLESKKETATTILEIGIGNMLEKNGDSIKLWKDYFTNATIYGIDVMPERFIRDDLLNEDRVILYPSSDAYYDFFFNLNFLDKITFDVMIDDGPHTLDSMKKFIKLYLPLMKEDGIFIIESVQSMDWIDILKEEVPELLKPFVKIYDLRTVNDRYDDIVFTIDKTIGSKTI